MKKIITQIILTLLIFAGFFSLKILIINNWLDVVAAILGIFLGEILLRLIVYVGQHFLKKNK
jgi:hypothetical protein